MAVAAIATWNTAAFLSISGIEMGRHKDKGRIEGPFVPMLVDTMASPAWKAMSPYARVVYVALRSRYGHKIREQRPCLSVYPRRRRGNPTNPSGREASFGDIRRPLAHTKAEAYCCFFFAPATVGVFGLRVLGAGRMAPQGSFGF